MTVMSRKVNATYTADQVKSAFKVFEANSPPGTVRADALIRCFIMAFLLYVSNSMFHGHNMFLHVSKVIMYIWQGKALTRAGPRSSSSTRGRWQRVNKLCRICEYDDEQHVNAGSNFVVGPFCLSVARVWCVITGAKCYKVQ